jgi:hypothetical protein
MLIPCQTGILFDNHSYISGKHVGLPLAFKCIKASGGRVPRTLVGITRIYPVLYRERYMAGCKQNTSQLSEKEIGSDAHMLGELSNSQLCTSGCLMVVLL